MSLPNSKVIWRDFVLGMLHFAKKNLDPVEGNWTSHDHVDVYLSLFEALDAYLVEMPGASRFYW